MEAPGGAWEANFLAAERQGGKKRFHEPQALQQRWGLLLRLYYSDGYWEHDGNNLISRQQRY